MKAKELVIAVNAQDTFTDREEPRKAFWELYHGMEATDVEVLHFYGVGGEGKTTLLRKLQSEMEEKVNNKKYIYYNFETGTTMKAILYILSRQMMIHNPNLKFPLFDTAFIKHSELVGEDVDALLQELNKTLFDSEIVKGIFNVAGTVLPYSSQIEFFGKKGLQLYKRRLEKREQEKTEVSQIYYQINSSDVSKLLNDLPMYFAKDASQNTEKMVIMLDGYERMVNPLSRGEASKYDDLWLRGDRKLVQCIPNILWVIAGREVIEWPEEILPKEHKHLIGSLSEQDTMDFLNKSGITNPDLIQHIYKLTHGTPVYLDTCVNRFLNLKTMKGPDYEPVADDIGFNTEEIAFRYLRDMAPDQQKILNLLACLPTTWNDDLAKSVAEEIDYAAYWGQYHFLLKLSLIQKFDDRYKLHETFRDVVLNSMSRDEKDLIFKAVNHVQKETLDDGKVTLLHGKVESYLDNLGKQEETSISSEMIDQLKATINRYADSGDYKIAIRFADELILLLEQNPARERETFYLKADKIYYLCLLGTYKEAEVYGRKVRSEAALKLAEDDAVMLEITHNYATALRSLGACEEAKELHKKVYEDHKRIYGEEHQITLMSLNSLASDYYELGDYQSAHKIREQVYEARVRTLGEEHPNTIASLGGLANSYVKIGEYKKALEIRERVYESQVRVLGENHPETLLSLNNLANSYGTAGDAQKTIGLYEKVYQIFTEKLGEDHPYTLGVVNNLALSYRDMDESQKAQIFGEKAYEMRAKVLGAEHPDTLVSLNNLADIYEIADDEQKAREAYEKLYKAHVKLSGEEDLHSIDALKKMANSCWILGDNQNASELYKKLYEVQVSALGAEHLDTLTSMHSLANSYSMMGELQKAKECYEKAYEAYVRALGEDQPSTLTALHNLANAYYDLKDYQTAKGLYEKLLLGYINIVGEEHPVTIATRERLESLEQHGDNALAGKKKSIWSKFTKKSK